MVDHPLHRRIHLSRLCQEVGPPLGKDVFVHISAVEKAGLSNLNEGQVVEYEEVANKGKTSAENLKVQR